MDNKNVRSRRISYVIMLTSMFILTGIVIIIMKLLNIQYNCFFKHYLGVYCPGCGGTRMLVEIIHLHFYKAFRYNSFVFCTLPYVAYTYIKECICYINTGDTSKESLRNVIGYAILLIVFGIIRNTEMFNWLQPIDI